MHSAVRAMSFREAMPFLGALAMQDAEKEPWKLSLFPCHQVGVSCFL